MTRKEYISADGFKRIKKYDTYSQTSRSMRGKQVHDIQAVLKQTQPEDVQLPPQESDSQEPTIHIRSDVDTIIDSLNDTAIKQQTYTQADDSEGKQSVWASLLVKTSYALGFTIFIAIMTVSAKVFVVDKQLASQTDSVLSAETYPVDDQGIQQGTSDQPSEVLPDHEAFFAYQVAPEQPRFIRIPKLTTFARVKVLEKDGSLVADPTNIFDVGWYSGSVQPGADSGASLLFGHVEGQVQDGVFGGIQRLEAGDSIEIETGDGNVVRYAVQTIEELPDVYDLSSVLSGYESEHGLRLIAATSDYQPGTKSRLMIEAVLTD